MIDLQLIVLGLLGIGIKLLLIPAYFSTDFDVHHNWLRITYTKPLSEWYYDAESIWTLDYPPFFAYFEYFLAWIANAIDPTIMKLTVTTSVLYFQRISVILTEIPFLYVLYIIFNRKVTPSLIFSYLFIPFIILDSNQFVIFPDIHFQYNIMLQTVFLLAVYFLIRKQNYLIAALTYSILLNFKHIYLYCSIAFFVLILKNYVLKGNKTSQNQNRQKLMRLVKVAAITILPFVVSFGPFIATGGMQGIKQMFTRLFPFRRGLIHDYWAPNFWALYYFTDKILAFGLKILFSYEPTLTIVTPTTTHKPLNFLKVLPEPSANMTLLIILVCLIPLVVYAIRVKKVNGLKMVLINGLVFFMFGYHVHEKAISPYLHLCFVFLASGKEITKGSTIQGKGKYQSIAQQEQEEQTKKLHTNENKSLKESVQMTNKQQILQVLCLIFFNIFNLFPLLIDIQQKPLKLTLSLLYWQLLRLTISQTQRSHPKINTKLYEHLSTACMLLIIMCEVVIPCANWTNGNKFQFLPLMVNSVACAVVNALWVGKVYWGELRRGGE